MLETAGLVKGVNFDTQITEHTEGGRLRPDFYIYTPDEGVIVIDSKAPMKLYKEAIEAQTEAEKQEKLLQHARNMLTHASSLGQKNYSQATERRTPDVVIMYVPNIAIYLAACEQIPDLIQQAWKHKVTICPPEAVYPVLKNVMLSWQQKKLHENAENIQKQALMIHSRLKTFYDYFSKIGKQLESAVNAFNSGAKSWDSRLLPAVRKIEEMGISDIGRELEQAKAVDTQPISIETDLSKEDD
jgi:DNA recombination protein RmuC